MLHITDSPLPVPLVKERLSVARTATIIYLQCRISPIGEPLCHRIEPPIIPGPRAFMQQNDEMSVGGEILVVLESHD